MADSEVDRLVSILETLATQISTPVQPSTEVNVNMTGGPGSGNMIGINVDQTAGPNTKNMTGFSVSVSDYTYTPALEELQLAEQLREGAQGLREGDGDLPLIKKALNKVGSMSDEVVNSALVKSGQKLVEMFMGGGA